MLHKKHVYIINGTYMYSSAFYQQFLVTECFLEMLFCFKHCFCVELVLYKN